MPPEQATEAINRDEITAEVDKIFSDPGETDEALTALLDHLPVNGVSDEGQSEEEVAEQEKPERARDSSGKFTKTDAEDSESQLTPEDLALAESKAGELDIEQQKTIQRALTAIRQNETANIKSCKSQRL